MLTTVRVEGDRELSHVRVFTAKDSLVPQLPSVDRAGYAGTGPQIHSPRAGFRNPVLLTRLPPGIRVSDPSCCHSPLTRLPPGIQPLLLPLIVILQVGVGVDKDAHHVNGRLPVHTGPVQAIRGSPQVSEGKYTARPRIKKELGQRRSRIHCSDAPLPTPRRPPCSPRVLQGHTHPERDHLRQRQLAL